MAYGLGPPSISGAKVLTFTKLHWFSTQGALGVHPTYRPLVKGRLFVIFSLLNGNRNGVVEVILEKMDLRLVERSLL